MNLRAATSTPGKVPRASEPLALAAATGSFSPLINSRSNWNIKNNASHCCQLGIEEMQLLAANAHPTPTVLRIARPHLHFSYVASSSFVTDGYLHLRTQWDPTHGVSHDGSVKVLPMHCRFAPQPLTTPVVVSLVQLFNFTSGWVDTAHKFAQFRGNCYLPSHPTPLRITPFLTTGLFEANISLPTRAARGVWPAFWLMPDGKSALCFLFLLVLIFRSLPYQQIPNAGQLAAKSISSR